MIARTSIRLLVVAVLATLALPAVAEEPAYDQEAAMAAWAAVAEPGPVHALLATRAGEWTVTATSYMAPGAEPMKSESTCVGEMIVGGRFLTERVEGVAMGMPFEGFGLTGYDNYSHVVTSIWVDSMGTVMGIMTGLYEKPGEPMELFGEMLDPASGQTMKMRTITYFEGDDAHRLEYFMSMPGMDEYKAMDMTYARK